MFVFSDRVPLLGPRLAGGGSVPSTSGMRWSKKGKNFVMDDEEIRGRDARSELGLMCGEYNPYATMMLKFHEKVRGLRVALVKEGSSVAGFCIYSLRNDGYAELFTDVMDQLENEGFEFDDEDEMQSLVNDVILMMMTRKPMSYVAGGLDPNDPSRFQSQDDRDIHKDYANKIKNALPLDVQNDYSTWKADVRRLAKWIMYYPLKKVFSLDVDLSGDTLSCFLYFVCVGTSYRKYGILKKVMDYLKSRAFSFSDSLIVPQRKIVIVLEPATAELRIMYKTLGFGNEIKYADAGKSPYDPYHHEKVTTHARTMNLRSPVKRWEMHDSVPQGFRIRDDETREEVSYAFSSDDVFPLGQDQFEQVRTLGLSKGALTALGVRMEDVWMCRGLPYSRVIMTKVESDADSETPFGVAIYGIGPATLLQFHRGITQRMNEEVRDARSSLYIKDQRVGKELTEENFLDYVCRAYFDHAEESQRSRPSRSFDQIILSAVKEVAPKLPSWNFRTIINYALRYQDHSKDISGQLGFSLDRDFRLEIHAMAYDASESDEGLRTAELLIQQLETMAIRAAEAGGFETCHVTVNAAFPKNLAGCLRDRYYELVNNGNYISQNLIKGEEEIDPPR
jgi:hypothetical protein